MVKCLPYLAEISLGEDHGDVIVIWLSWDTHGNGQQSFEAPPGMITEVPVTSLHAGLVLVYQHDLDITTGVQGPGSRGSLISP